VADTDSDRIYQLAMKQVETNTNLTNAQHDINIIANAQRQDVIELKSADERIELKVDSHTTDFKIYKVVIGLIGSLMLGLAYLVTWIIEHIDTLRSMTK
jgi:hypothetical protein